MREKLYRSLIELTNGRLTSRALQKFAMSPASRPVIRLYARAYGIQLEEMKGDISDYKNLHQFFTRKLKDDARPLDQTSDSVISPVDGWADSGAISAGMRMVVKGKEYSLEEMLGSRSMAEKYEGGTYVLLYLSPAHYHRIHSPLDADVIHSYSLGRKSYPVNSAGLRYGKDVLAKNFRTVTELRHGNTSFVMVKVGAMFINSVMVTNQNARWQKGEEAAFFSFGSTVILLFERSAFRLSEELDLPADVRMGQKIGSIAD